MFRHFNPLCQNDVRVSGRVSKNRFFRELNYYRPEQTRATYSIEMKRWITCIPFLPCHGSSIRQPVTYIRKKDEACPSSYSNGTTLYLCSAFYPQRNMSEGGRGAETIIFEGKGRLKTTPRKKYKVEEFPVSKSG